MSIETIYRLRCDWPGCERGTQHQAETVDKLRAAVEETGWFKTGRLDFCGLHLRHDGRIGEGSLYRPECTYCGWQASQVVSPWTGDGEKLWLAHLPELLSPEELQRRQREALGAGSLVAAISWFTELSTWELAPAGEDWLAGTCPFCQRRHAIRVLRQDAQQTWTCFGCKRGGGRDNFHEQVEEALSAP